MSQVPRWRRILSAILLVVGCVLVPVSLSAVWVRNTLLDTDNYVSTVGPLASNPKIQTALADRITTAIFTHVDVNQEIADALPSKAAFLASPVANAVRNATEEGALRLVQSDRFQTLWENANRRAHGAVVNVLTGGGSRVSTKDGTIAINTGQIIANVKTKLQAKGIDIFDNVTVPASSQEFVLFQSEDLAKAQGAVDLLQTVAWVLPFLALACFAAAIALSGRRRRSLEHAAIGVALAVGVQLVLLKAGRNLYLDAVTTKKSTPGAAGAVWDQVTTFLRTAGITTIVVALLVALAAWIAGPSSAATGVRSWWKRTFGRSGEPVEGDAPVGAVATFVSGHIGALRGVGAAIAFVVLIVWTNPTALTVLAIALVLLVYLAIVEFLGRSGNRTVPADAP